MKLFAICFDENGVPQISDEFQSDEERQSFVYSKFSQEGGDYSDYLFLNIENDTPKLQPFHENLIHLNGSSFLAPPDESGCIIKYEDGEIVKEWWPNDDNYEEVKKLFDPPPQRPKFEIV